MSNARADTYDLTELIGRIAPNGISFDDANTLRRAGKTLHRWSELECGDGNDHGSWAIERGDDGTDEGLPYMVHHHYLHGKGKDFVSRTRIPDKEAGALKRVAEVCKRNGLHFYHQGDPRGCALYVSNEPLPDHDYTRGVACCA